MEQLLYVALILVVAAVLWYYDDFKEWNYKRKFPMFEITKEEASVLMMAKKELERGGCPFLCILLLRLSYRAGMRGSCYSLMAKIPNSLNGKPSLGGYLGANYVKKYSRELRMDWIDCLVANHYKSNPKE